MSLSKIISQKLGNATKYQQFFFSVSIAKSSGVDKFCECYKKKKFKSNKTKTVFERLDELAILLESNI